MQHHSGPVGRPGMTHPKDSQTQPGLHLGVWGQPWFISKLPSPTPPG